MSVVSIWASTIQVALSGNILLITIQSMSNRGSQGNGRSQGTDRQRGTGRNERDNSTDKQEDDVDQGNRGFASDNYPEDKADEARAKGGRNSHGGGRNSDNE